MQKLEMVKLGKLDPSALNPDGNSIHASNSL